MSSRSIGVRERFAFEMHQARAQAGRRACAMGGALVLCVGLLAPSCAFETAPLASHDSRARPADAAGGRDSGARMGATSDAGRDGGVRPPDASVGVDARVDSGMPADARVTDLDGTVPPDLDCMPGTSQCAGSAAASTCTASGEWSAPVACAASERCTGGACASYPSCAPGGVGMSDCGEPGKSCCSSLLVPGGSYSRAYTSLVNGDAIARRAPATVSEFRLDELEVTVGRFRQFVKAWAGGAGYTPPVGAGKHAHLNGGMGLLAGDGVYEAGWQESDNAKVKPLDASLTGCEGHVTWTSAPGDGDGVPINCVTWAEAYAFCIWDGGFLPSEAEWEFAAAGGDEHRRYPWGATAPGTRSEYAIYGCLYPDGPAVLGSSVGVCNGENLPAVGSARLGAARWGQLDVAGSVWEWNLDATASVVLDPGYDDPCSDCVRVSTAQEHLVRGGHFENGDQELVVTQRRLGSASLRYEGVGFRCARAP